MEKIQSPEKEKDEKSKNINSPSSAWSVRLRQPKYIIPIILLPFIVLFYYVFNNWGTGESATVVAKDSVGTNYLNPNMPGVSSEVTDAALKDKFGAYLDAYKHDKDASALDNIDNNPLALGNDFSSAYSKEDLERLRNQQKMDSLQRQLQKGQNDIDKTMVQIYSNTRKHKAPSSGESISRDELLKSFSFNADKPIETTSASDNGYNDQMRLFREQMSLLDSMQQSGKPSDKEAGDDDSGSIGKRKTLTNNFDKNRFDPERDSSFKQLPVSRNPGTKSSFNSLFQSKPEQQISAIIDQAIKATAGSRVRIRLLNDIFVGGQLVPKGTFIYGVVTGFQTQRVNISINQVFYENMPLPVKLDVFDNDGYLGLYVPGSTFREFTKEIGTQGTQGLSQVRTSDNSNVTTGLINQIFQSASTSVSKLVQKEKAFLKYNYIIYLKERN